MQPVVVLHCDQETIVQVCEVLIIFHQAKWRIQLFLADKGKKEGNLLIPGSQLG